MRLSYWKSQTEHNYLVDNEIEKNWSEQFFDFFLRLKWFNYQFLLKNDG
jgi:hypothetical protein